jgi:hypothetical protein
MARSARQQADGGEQMTITSTNHNPNNESKYARRRSIWKGHHNQLRDTIEDLREMPGMAVFEYLAHPNEVGDLFRLEWNTFLKISRRAPIRGEIMGQWVAPAIGPKLWSAAGNLRSDLKLIWTDFEMICGHRLGKTDAPYHGKSLVTLAFGLNSFDFIVSKYGYGEGLKRNHHFYQWQARGEGFQNTVHVDDYEDHETGTTLYVLG